MVFTTRFSGGKGGRNGFETELRRLGIAQKNGSPNHPQTRGKVERFQQTLKRWLDTQPAQPASLAQLQALLNTFADDLQHQRPHRSLPHQRTPATAYATRPKATPSPRQRHPRPRPHATTSHHRHRHPAPHRATPPHRHRPDPRPNPRHPARPGPAHPHHQRRHRRTPPRPHPRPRRRTTSPPASHPAPHRKTPRTHCGFTVSSMS